jgi:hypothetical protein
MTNFRDRNLDALATQLVKRADIQSINPSPTLDYLRKLRLEEIRDQFDRHLSFLLPLADWEKMPRAEGRS